jgi:ferredoxin
MNMAKIIGEGKTFDVDEGTNLRAALLAEDIDLYSAGAEIFNCHGHGTCGTCLVQVEGSVSVPTAAETNRTIFHPYSLHKKRRLACQTKVLGDLLVTKFGGYFGDGDEFVWTPSRGLSTKIEWPNFVQ